MNKMSKFYLHIRIYSCSHINRYAKDSSFYAIELLNEPTAPGVSLDTVTKYYRDGYEVVRKHSSTVFVIMCNRLSADKTELLSLGSSLDRTVIDVHYYNLFSDFFDKKTVQQHIDYVNNDRSAELSTVTTSNGPLTLVGKCCLLLSHKRVNENP